MTNQVGESIRTLLMADADVSALTGDRIRPLVVALDDELPAVRYEVETEYLNHSTGSASWQRATIKIDVFSTTYTDGASLRGAIKAALHNYAGTVGGVVYRPLRHVAGSDTDLTERGNPGEEVRVYRLAADFTALIKGE